MKNAYVDANVILRFLTGSPPEMAARARALFEAVEQNRIILFVEEIVIAETVWVLKSFYGYSSDEILRTVQALLSHDGLEAHDKPGLLAALNLFAEKNIDFADALVAVHMKQQGLQEIFSFDEHFDRLSGITRLSPDVASQET